MQTLPKTLLIRNINNTCNLEIFVKERQYMIILKISSILSALMYEQGKWMYCMSILINVAPNKSDLFVITSQSFL